MKTKTKNLAVSCILAIFFLGFALGAWLKPANAFSSSERRELKQFPDLTWDSVLAGRFMTDFESYTLDQFPFRDSFRTLKSLNSSYVFRQQDNNDIYIAEGYACAMEYPLNLASLEWASYRFRDIYEKYLKEAGCQVYFSCIPDKNYFLGESSGHLTMDYPSLFQTFEEQMDFAEPIDITPLLSLEDYYKTDTHWRQEKIQDVAQRIADAMGVTLNETYTEKTLENPFYGVYHGQSALPLPGESLHYLTNDILDQCKVYDHQNNREIRIYDMEKAVGRDPYEMFLSGSLSLITIENPEASTDRELILFRDSFGSSLTPLLVEGYHKITLVDVRYLQSNILDKFIEFDGQDVLFLYSTLVLNNSSTIK